MIESPFTCTSAPSAFVGPGVAQAPQSVAMERTAQAATMPRRILKKRLERRKPSASSVARARSRRASVAGGRARAFGTGTTGRSVRVAMLGASVAPDPRIDKPRSRPVSKAPSAEPR